MIKTIIFDYDGVIVDSFKNVFDVYKVICKELGKECPKTFEKFRKIYGYNSIECYQNLRIPEEEYERAGKLYKREILKKNPSLFPEIGKVLDELSKKYSLVLISSSYKEEVVQKLNAFQLLKYFKEILAKDFHDKHFDKSDSILNFLSRNGLASNEVILIGDRDIDYDEGKKAGLKKIILVE